MVPTYGQFCDAFRFHIGDTQIPGGQVWTNASGKLDPYLQQAYSELYKGFEGAAVANIKRTIYGIVPAYTSYINPQNFGAKNFSEPTIKPLWERPADTTIDFIDAIAAGTGPFGPITDITTTNPHNLALGDEVMIFLCSGVSDNINDQWVVSLILGPNQFRINGPLVTGTYSVSPTQGVYCKAFQATWSEVPSVPEILDYPQTPSGKIDKYAWIDGGFRVIPATVARQLKMVFYLSGNAPNKDSGEGTSLGFDDSLGFLAYRAAALAAKDRSYLSTFKTLNQQALGPTEQHADWGGLFGMLMRSKARSAARNPIVIGGYRDARRNAGFCLRW